MGTAEGDNAGVVRGRLKTSRRVYRRRRADVNAKGRNGESAGEPAAGRDGRTMRGSRPRTPSGYCARQLRRPGFLKRRAPGPLGPGAPSGIRLDYWMSWSVPVSVTKQSPLVVLPLTLYFPLGRASGFPASL